MKLLRRRTNKPKGRLSAFAHIALRAILPVIIYVLVRLEFTAIAFVVVLLSKWRIFAVKPRHWPANVRSNAVDIFVGLSTVVFVSIATTQLLQVFICVLYALWLLLIKPKSSVIWIGIQGMVGQTASLVAIFLIWNSASVAGLVLAVWVVTYFSARHFLGAFDEPMSRASAQVWAFFSASLTWLCCHWLLYYSIISQPVLILTVIGYGLAALYYLQHTDKLTKGVRRQFVVLMVAIILFILVFSDWSGDIV